MCDLVSKIVAMDGKRSDQLEEEGFIKSTREKAKRTLRLFVALFITACFFNHCWVSIMHVQNKDVLHCVGKIYIEF